MEDHGQKIIDRPRRCRHGKIVSLFSNAGSEDKNIRHEAQPVGIVHTRTVGWLGTEVLV